MNYIDGSAMQAKLIDLSLLSAEEVTWLNDYHSQVWEKVSTRSDPIIICCLPFFFLFQFCSSLFKYANLDTTCLSLLLFSSL